MHTDSLDTNLLVHYVVGDNKSQRLRVARLLDESSTTHYLETYALIEAVYVLETIYEYTREEIVGSLNLFLARYSSVLVYNRPLIKAVFPFYAEHPKLSFSDCCLAAAAELNGAEPLFTFDKKLANQHPSAKLLA